MIIICNSLGLIDGTSSDNLIPSGDVVTISVIDVAVELPGTSSCAIIAALQDEEKGTPMHDPSNGVVPTSFGWVEHDWLDDGANT